MDTGLIAWLEIEHRILKARRPVEVAFIAVNEAHALAPYRQAALWSRTNGAEALSGAAMIEAGSPYVLWLNQVMAELAAKFTVPAAITAADLSPVLAEQWAEWFPVHALFLNMGESALIFIRDEVWTEEEAVLLERLADLVRLAHLGLRPRPSLAHRIKHLAGGRMRLATAALVLIGLFPVTGSVLSPAESVPAHPVLVRAPLDGVIGRIHVSPNQSIAEGQELFDLDTTTLGGKRDVALQQQATAQAEYRQAAQAMVFDPKAKAQVAILAGKADERTAEANWLNSQLERIRVKAPKSGIAVFDDPSDWVGKPVAVGEKVMVVADETDTEVEAWVSVSDVGEAQPGATLTLFLNTQPLSPLRAVVRSVAYEASARPDATLAHRVRATLAEGETKPRLGLKGTARIDGESVPLAWWLFRRPFATVRQTLGF